MQNLARDEAGNVWEIDEAGNPVRLAEPAGQGRVFSLPPNPKEVRQEAREDRRDDRADRREERAETTAERQNRIAEERLQFDREKAEREARKAEFAEGGSAVKRAEWRANLNNIGVLEQTIADLRRQYDANFKGKGLQSIAESFAPKAFAPEYGVFDVTAQSMLADMAKAKGLTAQQFNTPAEQRMFFEPLIPKRGDTDEEIEAKLANLERMVRTGRQTTEQNLGLAEQRADNEVPDPTTGADLKPPAPGEMMDRTTPTDLSGEAGPRQSVASGPDRQVYDARLSAQVDAMINAGASKAMIDAVVTRQGFPTINAGDLARAKQWMKANPGKRYFGAQVSRTEDMNLLQRAAGSDTGAFLAQMANNATAGIPAALAGPEGQGALDAMAANSPTAAGLGGVTGGVTGVLGAEAAVAARAPAALARFAPRIADTLYGGLLGFNQAREGEGGSGALMGAGLGLAGGLLGERAMRGVGRIARGVSDPDVQALRAADVPLTVGQTVGNSGFLGRTVRGAEDRMSGLWGVGDVVKDRQLEGVEAFANRMANDAVEPIGGTAPEGYGQALVDSLLEQGGDAYTRATQGANVPLDQQFAADMLRTRAIGSTLPDDLSGRFGQAIDNRIAPIEADTYLTGDSFQQAVRGLKSYRAEATKPGFEQDYRDALSTGIDALRDQMNRGGGADVVENLANADQAWKRIKVIERATNAARNGARSNEVGLPMPSQFNDAATAAAQKFGGPRFNGDLIDAAQRVLPNRVPDSGTAGRLGFGGLMLGGTAAGAGAGAPFGVSGEGAGTGLGLTLLAAVGGSKPAQRALTAALADRPEWARGLGNILFENARLGGGAGAGAAIGLIDP